MRFSAIDAVTITLAPSVLLAEGGDRRIEIAPVIWLGTPTGRTRGRPLLGIGGALESHGASAIRVPVFDPSAQPPFDLDRKACIERLFREVLRGFIEQSFLRTKPIVTVRGSGSVMAVLGDKGRTLLDEALKCAGAKAVVFAD